MRVRCDRSELVEKLAIMAGVVPSSSPKPILLDFLLRTAEGALLVEATDLEVAGQVRIDRVEVMEDGKLALPAARLLSILREIPDQSGGVTLEPNPEINGATLRADGYEFKLFGHEPDEFPGIGEVKAERSVSFPREDFVHSLRRVAIAASRDPTRYQLGGVYFEIRDGKLTLTATDGKRLTNDYLKLDALKDQEVHAIVPNRAVDAILKMLSSPSAVGEDKFTLAFTEIEVVVKTGSSQLNAKLIEGTYPNYRNALPSQTPVKASLKRGDLLSAAKSAQLMTDTQTSTVVFRFEEDSLNISSQAKDIGETRIRIKARVENGPLEIRFNPSYFIDALRSIEDEEVRIELVSSERPGVVRGGAHYRHMIMPLVVER